MVRFSPLGSSLTLTLTLVTVGEQTCEHQLVLGASEEAEAVREWDSLDRRDLSEVVSTGANARVTS